MSDDSAWLALGLSDSTIRITAVNEKIKLKTIKPIQDLELLDKESGIWDIAQAQQKEESNLTLCCVKDDIMSAMFEESSASDTRSLIGHSGPVFAVSFSPDKNFLVSGSEDSSGLLTYFHSRNQTHNINTSTLEKFVSGVYWLIHAWLATKVTMDLFGM